MQAQEMDWNKLKQFAVEEVNQTMAALPLRLREHAARLPVTLERSPSQALIDDGFEPDLLGLYVGPSYEDMETAAADLPPQIILFLECLWDFCEGDEQAFREEVRTTYLHELGHYLGLDEGDLEERGLE